MDDEDEDNDGCANDEDYVQYMPVGRGADTADADVDEVISLKLAAEEKSLPQMQIIYDFNTERKSRKKANINS